MAMDADGRLSAMGASVRRHDPDRYLTALFAPPARRDALFTLYTFNHELARARETVREPMAALIRLQWWREVVEGVRPRAALGGHDVAGAVSTAVGAGMLSVSDLEELVTAREAEAEPIETLDAFQAYILGAAGGLMVAAGNVLGMADAERMRRWGAAFGVAGVLRSVPAHARQGRCLLPLDLVRAAGLSEGAVIADPHGPGLDPVRERLRTIAAAWAAERVAVPRAAVAAALPVVFARRDLRRASVSSGSARGRPATDRLAVAIRGLVGRV